MDKSRNTRKGKEGGVGGEKKEMKWDIIWASGYSFT